MRNHCLFNIFYLTRSQVINEEHVWYKYITLTAKVACLILTTIGIASKQL